MEAAERLVVCSHTLNYSSKLHRVVLRVHTSNGLVGLTKFEVSTMQSAQSRRLKIPLWPFVTHDQAARLGRPCVAPLRWQKAQLLLFLVPRRGGPQGC